MNRTDTPRIIIVDDHSLVAEGIRRILEPEFDLVAIVFKPSEVIPAIEHHMPDVILLDISMPGRTGIETAREIRTSFPAVKVIFLTMHTESVYVQQAMRTGAHAYILKGSLVSELIHAIRSVLAGRTFLSPAVRDADQPESLPGDLSPKQREVLELVASGRSDKEIANFMNISVKTVEFHKTSIRRRLGLHSTAELVKFALTNGI
jgi:DNA-binding NarL/FixJ family response regulator